MSDVTNRTPHLELQVFKGRPGWRTIYKRLSRNRVALAGGYLILFFIIIAIIGPFFTVHDPVSVDYSVKLLPPKTLTKAMANKMPGKARRISIKRITILSSIFP